MDETLESLAVELFPHIVQEAVPSSVQRTRTNFEQLCNLFGDQAQNSAIRGELLTVAAGLGPDQAEDFFGAYKTFKAGIGDAFQGENLVYVVRAAATMYNYTVLTEAARLIESAFTK